MARLIHGSHHERALRRERVLRDRTNPLDIYDDGNLLYDDRELIERFSFYRAGKCDLIEELSPLLQHPIDRNGASPPAMQLLIALRFYANGSFQNTSQT